MNSDKVQYNPQLDDAAQCILEDDREMTALAVSEALEASCDGAAIWLFKAWCGQSLAEVEESLERAAALDPENKTASSGLAWIKGLNELAAAHFEAKQRAEEEAEARRKAEEEAEAKRKAEEEAEAKRKADAERKAREEAEAQRKAEEEAKSKRKADEEARAEQVAEAQTGKDADVSSEYSNETEKAGEESGQPEPEGRSEAGNDEFTGACEKQIDALPPVVAGNMGVVTRVEKLRPVQVEEEVLAEVESLKVEVHEELCGPRKQELRQQECEQEIAAEQDGPASIEQNFKNNSDENDESSASNATADEHKPVVLAVDDSPTIRKLVSLTLTGAGYEVITASDGVEALTMLNDRIPDIVLSDINMPKLNGYKLCKFIKKHEAWKSIPVVMLSGKDGLFDKMRGKMNGCDDFISKPFESEDLIAKVREHLAVTPAG